MEALGASQNSGQCLKSGAHDVVLRLLGSEAASGGLGVESHEPRLRLFGLVFFPHVSGPDAPGGPVFGDLLEEIQMGIEEQRKPGSKCVNVQPGFHGRLHVGESVGQGEG